MSDLQCPARFLVLSEPDATQAEALRHERVAAVYDAPPGTSASALAGALGLAVQVLERSLSQADVVAEEPRTMDELRDLADLHRGETVVVLAEGEPGRALEVAVDGDGVRVRRISPEALT